MTQWKPWIHGLAGASATLLAGGAQAVQYDIGDTQINVGGYLRQYVSTNLSDNKDLRGDDQFDVSMLRSVVQLNADTQVGPLFFKAIGRIARERLTSYSEDLEDEHNARFGGAPFFVPRKTDFNDQYNEQELREFYVAFDLGERLGFTVGRQQVVWGESDFFQAMDIVQGYDFRWRAFLEPENEDTRRPLAMINGQVKVPELNGTLQVLLRPGGWGRDYDIGSLYDTFGGRWAPQKDKGTDILSFLRYNYNHSDGDVEDTTWGLRWSGLAGPVQYTLNYLRWFGTDPVVDSIWNPTANMDDLKGLWGSLYFPKLSTYGFTASGYVEPVDAVFSTEIAYTKDKPYNLLGSPDNCPFGGTGCGGTLAGQPLPSLGGVSDHDTVRAMVRMDKQLRTEGLLGTARPSLFSVQVFDTWLLGYDKRSVGDPLAIVDGPGHAAIKKEHSTVATAILAMNYRYDTINPTFAAGWDPSNNGGFFIPSVDLVYGEHWRIRFEADLFFHDGDSKFNSGNPWTASTDTHLFGYFANNNQLLMRATYQF